MRGTSVLIHNYPPSWADVYVGFNLGASDPIRRAAERSLLGFRWNAVSTLIPVSGLEHAISIPAAGMASRMVSRFPGICPARCRHRAAL
ncbi:MULTISPECIES: autoinducer binding domain-containing protein [unclassified Sphingomonas]|uniref:autoinducer binding domain-containing protein n=1 Tax=unclassified Sphingomonas TaxID=196159 RepID=UPI0025ED8392|nr:MULTISPECIES: autoinducer binding domain-containing protein [unclassified Sphingomonas]